MKILFIILTILIADFYYFPIETVFFSGINSKMILAVIGLGILVFRLIRNGNASISKDIFKLTLWAFGISLASLLSMSINNTHDASFLTYFISMWVWLAGAYTFIFCIKSIHNQISVELLCNYLIAVCVLQCCLAIFLNKFPAFDATISSFLAGEKFMGGEDIGDRLHGIACALDVAAIRFSAVLVMIAYLVINKRHLFSTRKVAIYMGAFLLIAIVGNMIGRTVTIGIAISLIYWAFEFFKGNFNYKILRTLGILLLTCIPLLTIGYNNNKSIHHHLRFGFEGFFSIYEKGHWETGSNNVLKNMVVFPDNPRTWIIGDGYAANPSEEGTPYYDPYYIGETFHGYYKQTDIGYLRYIFYFGIIGLGIFICYFIAVGQVCMKNLYRHQFLFILLLAVNFIVWFKVSTDLFIAFAPFLCLSQDDEILEEQEELELQHAS